VSSPPPAPRSSATRHVRYELTGGEQYRLLSEEYRRLSDLAITAQEHTDLKLGEVTAQLDHMQAKMELDSRWQGRRYAPPSDIRRLLDS
jgi:hypothetical protein